MVPSETTGEKLSFLEPSHEDFPSNFQSVALHWILNEMVDFLFLLAGCLFDKNDTCLL